MSNPRAAIRINLVMGGLSEQGADALLDAYAHELAEKQRAWAAAQGGRELRIEPEQLPSIVQAAVGLAADLIDPEKPDA